MTGDNGDADIAKMVVRKKNIAGELLEKGFKQNSDKEKNSDGASFIVMCSLQRADQH